MIRASKEQTVKDKLLVSIIVPVYNVEKYLARCLDSIIAQTYKNLQIIVVDDGSTDGSGKICDEYAKKDKRIEVYHKKNGGLSDARNYGIKKAEGEYINLIDSDDYIPKKSVEILLEEALRAEADMAVGGHTVIYPSQRHNKLNDKQLICNNIEALEKLLYDDGIDTSAWGKLYKKDLFRNIKYPTGRLYEDSATTYRLIDASRKIVVIPSAVYYYVIRTDSISQDGFNSKKMDLIISTKEMTDYISRKYPSLESGCKRRLMYAYLSTLAQTTKSKKRPTEVRELMSYIKKNTKQLLRDNRITSRDRVALHVCRFGYVAFKTFWIFYSLTTGRLQ